MNYIAKISIEENALVRAGHNRRERDLVITDLLEKSSISLFNEDMSGPFSISISVVSNKVIVGIQDESGKVSSIEIAIMPLRKIIKDYSIICASYFDAVKNADPRKVEAIDMGRRSLHNEGAMMLQEQLNGKLVLDFETMRKFFSLIYLLQER